MLGESQINSSICSLNAKGLHVKGIAIDLTELQMRASCKLLTMPDDKLLHCTSTSPLHEDAGYAAGKSDMQLPQPAVSSLSCDCLKRKFSSSLCNQLDNTFLRWHIGK